MKLYMDESGNGNPSQPLIVGAVEVGDDADEVEQRIRDLHKRLSARSSLAGFPSFEEFRKNGFHGSSDPTEVSGPFLELMPNLSFRAYMVVTDPSSVPAESEAEKLEFMYENLLGDVLIRHRNEPELLCYVEQNDDMRAVVRRLPERAARQAYEKLGKKVGLPRLNVVMVAKADCMSIAIVDYAMLAVTRWLQSGCSTDPKNRPYRGFREIEPFISVLYSLEQGRISSRKEPLH